MSILSMCNSTATVSRPVVVSNGKMGQSKTFNALYDNVPVSVQPLRSQMIVESGQAVSRVSHFIYTPIQMTLQPDDVIQVGGDTYKFVGMGDMAGRGQGWKILVNRDSN